MKIRTLLIALATLPACNSSKKTTKKYTELEPLAVKAKALPPAKYQGAAERVWDILHTEIHVNFHGKGLNEKFATGRAELMMAPYAQPQDTIRLDAKGLRIISADIVGAWRGSLRHEMVGDTLVLFPSFNAEPVQLGDTLGIEIAYDAKPYARDAKGSAAIREARGLYFINTDHSQPKLPAQIWTQGETESNSHWFPTIDKPNERFTTDIHITVPDSFTTLSNGVLVSSKKDGATRTDHWKMDKPIQPYAVMMAIGKYSIVEDEKWRGIPVNYYVEPAYAPTAKQMFKHTPEMMEFFSRVTGVPYPWPKYSQVVVRDFVSGAMENTSASTFGEFMNRNARELLDGSGEDVVSHELFHQWFGDYATAESWSNLTVNESFATYGEVLWRRYKYGDDAADEQLYQDVQRYLGSTERTDPPLVRFYYRDKEEMFDRVSYQKGGAILHYMHRLMGDSAFSRAMKIYLTDNALQPTEAHDWRKAVEKATGQDWNPFFNQWYFRGGHPVVEVTHHYDDAAGMLRVALRQTGKDSAFLYNLPMQMGVFRDGELSHTDWTMTRRLDTFTLTYPPKTGRPIVIPDAGHWVVGEVQDKRPDELFAQWSTIFERQQDFFTRRAALASIRGKEGTPTGRAILASALAANYPPMRTLAAQQLSSAKDTTLRPQFAETLARMARTDTATQTRAAAISALTAWRDERVMPIAATAVDDSSYLVAGTALTAIDRIEESGKNGTAAYSEARRLLPTAKRGDLWRAATTVIAQYGKAEDTIIFQREIDRVEPAQYASVLSAYATLASRSESRAAFSSYLKSADALLRAASSDEGDRRAYALTLFQLGGALRTPGDATKALGEAEISARTEATRSLLSSVIEREANTDLQTFLRNSYRTNFPNAATKK